MWTAGHYYRREGEYFLEYMLGWFCLFVLLWSFFRGTIEEYLLNLCGNELVSDEPCRESKQYIVLLDNIDDVSGSMVRSRSLVECSISSAVITVVDRVILSGRGKCVLTSTCPPNQLHERLMQPCRISTSIFLDYPSFELRQTSVLAALLESNCTLLLDDDCSPPCEQMVSNSTHGMQEWAVAILTKLSESVARRTQGCTITDVANVVRNAMLYAEPMSSRVDRRVMSRSDIRSGVVVMCQHGSESMFTGIRKKLSSSNGDDRTVCLSLSVIARSLDLLSKPIVDVGMLGSGSTADGASVANLTFVDAFGALPGVSGVTEGVPLVGMEDIQQKLKRTVLGPYCSETKQFFQRLGIRPCSGVVIQSPPGCGKTALSNWLVREGREHFKCISVSCAELVDKVVGASEQKLSNIFAVARLHAPCFLLLENIDCILGKAANDDDFPGGDGGGGSKRSLQRTSHHALDRILSTMLVELDGIQKSSDREMASALDFAGADAVSANIVAGKDSSVVVIATTSDMSLLDGALLRPGRLEEHVFIKAPTAAMVRFRVVMYCYS